MDRPSLSVMDSRGTKFTIGAIYPPEERKHQDGSGPEISPVRTTSYY
jgi:hypothetical protein